MASNNVNNSAVKVTYIDTPLVISNAGGPQDCCHRLLPRHPRRAATGLPRRGHLSRYCKPLPQMATGRSDTGGWRLGARPPPAGRRAAGVAGPSRGLCCGPVFAAPVQCGWSGTASTSCKACRGTPRAHPGDTFLPRRPLACCACRPSLPSSSICFFFCYSADVEVTKQLLAFGLTSNSR
jgi:hypothetical protein